VKINQARCNLVASHNTLLDNYKISIRVFLDNWTLGEVLGSAFASMIGAFPANDISVLVLL
jgi:hypothetical protein